MGVRVRLLGQVSLESDETIVAARALPGRQGRVALAHLVLARGPVTREVLADLVWPNSLPKSWERDLSAVMSKLKGPLSTVGAPDAVRSALGCYEIVLPEGSEIDVVAVRDEIDRAEAALRSEALDEAWAAATDAAELSGRPFLPGESGRWVDGVRDDLLALSLRASEALVAIEASRERWPQAVRHAEAILTQAPLRESAHAALINALVGAGNRAEALRAYERARTLIAEELGVPPSAILEAAYERALTADAPRPPERAAVGGTVTLVFTDLVDSTAQADRLSAEESEVLRRAHFRILRDAAATTGGHEVKNLGDGLMLAFSRSRDALSCAVTIQESIERHNRDDVAQPLSVRVGLHAGEPVIDEGDYFGMPVVIAKRLCDVAAGGEIIASNLVCELANASEGFDLAPLELLQVKGVEDAVPARRVAWAALPDAALPMPTVLRMQEEFAFVGRAAQVERIVERVHAAQQPGLVVVEGEPGIGKTRLLAEAAALSYAAGATVLWGRCSEEPLTAYQPFVEALDHVVGATPVHELRAIVGQGAQEIARLVPRLADRLPSTRPPTTAGDADRLALFSAIAQCFGSLSRTRPVAVVLDDLHWADASTLQLLVHLLRHPESGRLTVLAAVRAGQSDWSSEAASGFAEVVRTERLTRLSVDGLDEREVTALLDLDDHRMHPEGFALARTLLDASGGNPFFIREILHSLVEAGDIEHVEGRWLVVDPYRSVEPPAGVVAVVRRRVSRLTEPGREVLAVASVVGNDFDVATVAEVINQPADVVLDLLEEAVTAALIVEPQGGIDRFRFTHAIVRDALHAEIGVSRRSRYHRAVAEAIERLGGHDDRVGELAYHWSAAGAVGDLDRAAEYAELAGTAALAQFAYDEAARQFDIALRAARALGTDTTRVHALLLRLADAYARASDPRAAATYEEVIDGARHADDAVSVARAVIGVTNQWVLTSLVDEARTALIEEAIDRLGDRDVPERAALLGRLAEDLFYRPGTRQRLDDLTAEAVAVARRIGDPAVLGQALHDRNYALWEPGREHERLADGREITGLAQRAGDAELELRGIGWTMDASVETGDIDGFASAATAYERVATALKRPRHLWYANTRAATLDILRGDLDRGARRASEALAEGRRIGEPDALNVYTGSMWPCWLERPDDVAVDVLGQALDAMLDAGVAADGLVCTLFRSQRATLLAVLDRERDAIAELDILRQQRLPNEAPATINDAILLAVVAGLVAMLGASHEAAALYELARAYDGTWAGDGSIVCGSWSHRLGALAARAGDPRSAVGHLGIAIEHYDGQGCSVFAARARLERARVSAEHARFDLETAAAVAAERGLPLLARDVAVLLET